jgi:hypothetical protein
MPAPVLAPIADPCPACHPGDHSAVFPFLVSSSGGGLRAWYRHDRCARSWSCWWSADGSPWPLSREVAPPVETERAPEPLGSLLDALIGSLAGLFDSEETKAAAVPPGRRAA